MEIKIVDNQTELEAIFRQYAGGRVALEKVERKIDKSDFIGMAFTIAEEALPCAELAIKDFMLMQAFTKDDERYIIGLKHYDTRDYLHLVINLRTKQAELMVIPIIPMVAFQTGGYLGHKTLPTILKEQYKAS